MNNQFIVTNLPVAYLLVAFFALAIGSLLNVIIYRLPLMLRASFSKDCRSFLQLPAEPDNVINLFFPRSFCPNCRMIIPAKYNIPLLSYCWLRGRCKNCHQPISARYPLVEILSCLLALLSVWHFGFSLNLIFVLLFVWIIIALFFIDLEQQLLPDSLTLSLLWLGLIANTQSLFTSLPNAVLSAVFAYLTLWLFIKLFYLLTARIGMGNGDFKLFAALGAWFGWEQLPLILLFASFVGAITGIFYLRLQKKTKDTPIPFGPFLCLAGLLSLFWGKTILHWYLSYWF